MRLRIFVCKNVLILLTKNLTLIIKTHQVFVPNLVKLSSTEIFMKVMESKVNLNLLLTRLSI